MIREHASLSEERHSVRAVGICLGASTISAVRVERTAAGDVRIVDRVVQTHGGHPRGVLADVVGRIRLGDVDRVAATGRRFRDIVRLTSIPEPEAVECAYAFVKPPDVACPAIVSAGGETFMVYLLNEAGRIKNVVTGGKCASGTGEFFLQQLRRMDVDLEDIASWGPCDDPYHVSGRCSVFCKSDCTHATNKGVPKSRVAAGLCVMMSDKILELLKRVERRDIMLVGGASRNRMMVANLREQIDHLIVPDEAPSFEALGAALWSLDHDTLAYPGPDRLIREGATSHETLPPLTQYEDQVEFRTMERGRPNAGDRCILGLDVGSTTTKAVLVRSADNAMLASEYLRTLGDPVGASRRCYRAVLDQLAEQVDPADVLIEGLGVTGSGRQIAGLHAQTDGVINEIMAHATAAAHFDPSVDTLFEIGGQDAKYTYLTHGTPTDYAMNEACSAGTGSFLEESANETLDVAMQDIGAVALRGKHPPNFNDQCAAFIASDIKRAVQEGVGREDIVAGLVYSICMNYVNRVKGNRPVGQKVFMQGGVCYNRAVPLAMAGLTGKSIVVPPEPGLMGAYGVALGVKQRMAEGVLEPQTFDLRELAEREVTHASTFVCKGGKSRCDRRCEISVIELEGRRYPFGGACNRYYNLRHRIRCDVGQLDLVQARERLIFETYAGRVPAGEPVLGRVGLNRSFYTHAYYPLYSNFFAALGYETVMPDVPSHDGMDQRNAAFCFPAELAHGFFHTLIQGEPVPEFIFLPHFKSAPDRLGDGNSQVCPLAQSETFYLRAAFKARLRDLEAKGIQVLTPTIDLTRGEDQAEAPLLEVAAAMRVPEARARRAYAYALDRHRACTAELRSTGRAALDALAADPDAVGVALFGRPYNGYAKEAHLGIPGKIASRNVVVLPLDMLPFEEEEAQANMYWGMGQVIIKAARFVERHAQLFGVYVTNFSCGPDSFLCGFFRQVMGRKPSLTLELDSHTADAGVETRVEAFLDVVRTYQRNQAQGRSKAAARPFSPARLVQEEVGPRVITSSGEHLPLSDPRVIILLPSMGRLMGEGMGAAMRGGGVRARGLPPADEEALKLGRGHTSCKECLPHILTVGCLLKYLKHERKPGEVVVYLFPSANGPCRLGQYNVFTEQLIERLRLEDLAIMSANAANSYMGFDEKWFHRAWWSVVCSDVMEDIRVMFMANACDPGAAAVLFEEEWARIVSAIEDGIYRKLEAQLKRAARAFASIKLRRPIEEVPRILLTGEIFVRRDALSRRHLSEWLAARGFATACVPVTEWGQYCNYMVGKGINNHCLSPLELVGFHLRRSVQNRWERRIKRILASSGWAPAEPVDVDAIVRRAAPHLSSQLHGEAVLTVGGALEDIATRVCGVISIGPFGCMPCRISEAILNVTMNREGKFLGDGHDPHLREVLEGVDDLPFLAIETDGSPFPQLVLARLEAFCLQADRLHERMQRPARPGEERGGARLPAPAANATRHTPEPGEGRTGVGCFGASAVSTRVRCEGPTSSRAPSPPR